MSQFEFELQWRLKGDLSSGDWHPVMRGSEPYRLPTRERAERKLVELNRWPERYETRVQEVAGGEGR